MIVGDLFDLDGARPDSGDSSEPNPFVEQDALYESQILDVRYNAVRSVLGIIFEMRLADRIRDCGSALIVASEISDFSWQQIQRDGQRTAWTVLASTVRRVGDSITMELLTSPNARLTFSAKRASYYSLTLDGIADDSAPPDYSSSTLAEIRAQIAGWNSMAQIVREIHI